MGKYPQKHLKIPQVPVAVLDMDTIGCLPVTPRGHHWDIMAIYKYMPYVFSILMMEKSTENAIQAYLSGIFAHKGGSIAILSDNLKHSTH